MLNDWFYANPTWVVMLAVCSVLVVFTSAGLILFSRVVDWHARERDLKMVGLSYALAGGIYAVLIAFVAVGVFQTMTRGETTATAEANALTGLAFDTAGLPPAAAAQFRADVDRYIDIVTHSEWASQQSYQMQEHNFAEGWAQLRRLNRQLTDYQPTTPGQAIVKQEMTRGINELVGARRARLLAANAHLPEAIWQMMLCGVVLVAVYLYMFGPHSFGIHLSVSALTMISIGLVFTLIIALDYPFRGDLSVGDDAYFSARQTAATVFPPTAAPK